jgi:uncharacterized membrane-anchored protein
MMFDNKKIMCGLLATIVLQLTVLIMEYGNAVYPLLTGQEIKIKVIPVDPRSLFRGNYARLNYDISRVTLPSESRIPRVNELVYIGLKENGAGIYEEVSVSLLKPDTGIFIKGRVKYSRTKDIQVRYGIEAFFAPKEKALDLEKKLRTGGVAIIKVAKNGKPALLDIVAN